MGGLVECVVNLLRVSKRGGGDVVVGGMLENEEADGLLCPGRSCSQSRPTTFQTGFAGISFSVKRGTTTFAPIQRTDVISVGRRSGARLVAANGCGSLRYHQ